MIIFCSPLSTPVHEASMKVFGPDTCSFQELYFGSLYLPQIECDISSILFTKLLSRFQIILHLLYCITLSTFHTRRKVYIIIITSATNPGSATFANGIIYYLRILQREVLLLYIGFILASWRLSQAFRT
ncbi:hypothetical protein K501DRAFT_308435 [Backusella circina FSU 941]|nr:hypothetical protein K501DRAFT_308435 [Backusella circina FSU 941]